MKKEARECEKRRRECLERGRVTVGIRDRGRAGILERGR